MHGGLKQDCIVKSQMPYQYLSPVGQKLCDKLGISSDCASLTRAMIIILNAIANFNDHHHGSLLPL